MPIERLYPGVTEQEGVEKYPVYQLIHFEGKPYITQSTQRSGTPQTRLQTVGLMLISHCPCRYLLDCRKNCARISKTHLKEIFYRQPVPLIQPAMEKFWWPERGLSSQASFLAVHKLYTKVQKFMIRFTVRCLLQLAPFLVFPFRVHDCLGERLDQSFPRFLVHPIQHI